MNVKLAAICPCILVAGAATAMWLPKSWEPNTLPPAQPAPAIHSIVLSQKSVRRHPIAVTAAVNHADTEGSGSVADLSPLTTGN